MQLARVELDVPVGRETLKKELSQRGKGAAAGAGGHDQVYFQKQ